MKFSILVTSLSSLEFLMVMILCTQALMMLLLSHLDSRAHCLAIVVGDVSHDIQFEVTF